MRGSQLVKKLNDLIAKHGDLPVVGGYLADDTTPREVMVVDKEGVTPQDGGGKPVGIFISQ